VALGRLGLALPPAPRPVGSYAPIAVAGTLAFVAGQIVTRDGRAMDPGLVDRDVSVVRATELARLATLQALAALDAEPGRLDRIERAVHARVYVATSPGFDRVHEVAGGVTDLLTSIFGETRRPARATVGVAALPLNAPVEVELVFALR